MRFVLVLLLLVASVRAFAQAQAPLCAELQALTEDPTVAAAHWGVSVTTLEGAPLCEFNERQLFRPASNAKLFTLAAALALLGPERTFETRVTGKLDPATGIVAGDLTLVGGGDANLDSRDLPYVPPAQRPAGTHGALAFHDLDELAAQLVARGVKSVAGDVVGDDRLFPFEPYGESWSVDDLVWGYGAPVSALTLADNQLRLTVRPGKAGARALAVLEQNGVSYDTLRNEVTTEPAGSKAALGVQVERVANSPRTLRIFGTMAADSPPDVEEIAIDDPAAFAAMAFRSVLAAHGIAVQGRARAEHRLPTSGVGFRAQLAAPLTGENQVLGTGPIASCAFERNESPTLARHTSAALSADVVYTLKASQNLHAELLLHHLGQRVPCGSGSTAAGARMVRAFLVHAGLEPGDFVFFDGSGLSDHDLITPRAATTLLRYAAIQPWFAGFEAGLPVGGVDGTLLTHFTGALKGKVMAKTGTLGESRALSGYVVAASGRTLVFSILVDTHLPGNNADRAITERMLERIAFLLPL